MILHFSGTGNSRYIAERIAQATGDELLDLNEKIRKRDTRTVTADSRLVFVVPTYAWRIPQVVEQWILATEFASSASEETSCSTLKAWFVMTCGDEIGNADAYNQVLCHKKHWDHMGTAQIVMPENYVAMFAVPKPSTARKIIRNAEPKIAETIRQIEGGTRIGPGKISFIDRMKSRLVNPLFYRLFVKADGFFTTDECTGCGICAQLCPLRNITIVGEKPVWGQECTHCMACICRCPAEAVEYGKKSEGKPRYYFEPERKADDDEPE